MRVSIGILIVCVALAADARPALPVGVDLSAVACPGDPGASHDAGTIDCATGAYATLYLTFMPGESAPDLTGIDVNLDLRVRGDLESEAAFWEFEATNPDGMSVSHARPSSGCDDYTDTWGAGGSGAGWRAFRTNWNQERIRALAYRTTPLAYTFNQKLFGMAVAVDAARSADVAGGRGGCNRAAALLVNSMFPRLVSGNPTQVLAGDSVFGDCVTFNDASGTMCSVAPVRERTWGELRSLYR